MTSTLIIPVENQVRELDAKLLFACVAAERGFPTVLGSKQYLYFSMPHFDRGVFIAKSMRARSTLMFNVIRSLGNDIVAWDEESLVRYSSPEYPTWRFSKSTFSFIHHLFAWGHDDAEMFSAYSGNERTSVYATGNPRADLLRSDVREYFRDEADKLSARFGEFILVNTNFSFVNPFVKKLTLVQPAAEPGRYEVGRTGSGMSEAFAAGMAAHQQQIFDHFRTLVTQLGKWFPAHQVVVRPHPSEDHDVWRRIVADDANVTVNHEGNVVPWLMASKVLIHNGCTTAVEAAVLQRPAVTYQPVRSDCYDYHLPNALSHRAFALDEVKQIAESILNGDTGLIDEGERHRIFERHLAAITGPLAADRIVEVLNEEGYGRSKPPAAPLWRYAKGRLTSSARTMIKRINMSRRDHWNSARYHAHRFPDISVAEINSRIGRFSNLLGRFNDVRAEQLSQHIFRLARA